MDFELVEEVHDTFKRVDLSLDVETLSTTKECEKDVEDWDPKCAPVDEKSKVIQIGLVAFDPFAISNEDTLEKYSWGMNVDHDQPGRTESEDTVKWWGEQDPQIWHNITQDQIPHSLAACYLEHIISKLITPETRVWYRGDSFDHTILQDFLYDYRRQIKVPFYNVRDVRSVEELAFGKGVQKNYRFGDHHDAVHDAMSQARLVQECFRRTRELR